MVYSTARYLDEVLLQRTSNLITMSLHPVVGTLTTIPACPEFLAQGTGWSDAPQLGVLGVILVVWISRRATKARVVVEAKLRQGYRKLRLCGEHATIGSQRRIVV